MLISLGVIRIFGFILNFLVIYKSPVMGLRALEIILKVSELISPSFSIM